MSDTQLSSQALLLIEAALIEARANGDTVDPFAFPFRDALDDFVASIEAKVRELETKIATHQFLEHPRMIVEVQPGIAAATTPPQRPRNMSDTNNYDAIVEQNEEEYRTAGRMNEPTPSDTPKEPR